MSVEYSERRVQGPDLRDHACGRVCSDREGSLVCLVWGLKLGFRVQGSGFRVQGSGCRVQGSGVRVQGAGFRAFTRTPVPGRRIPKEEGTAIRTLADAFTPEPA